MKYLLLLLLLSSTASAQITSPRAGPVSTPSINLEWQNDASKYWVMAFDDNTRYINSGSLTGTSYEITMPQDGSAIRVEFYRYNNGWSKSIVNYTSKAGSSESSMNVVKKKCVVLPDSVPSITSYNYVYCDVECLIGVVISASAKGTAEPTGIGASSETHLTSYSFGIEGLGEKKVRLYANDPPPATYFNPYCELNDGSWESEACHGGVRESYTIDAVAVCG